MENLSTVSNGTILETGGMLFVEAEAEGKELKLKPGVEMTISVPAPKALEGMELFNGERDIDGDMNWIPVNQAVNNEQSRSVFQTTASYIDYIPRRCKPVQSH